jgi:hypothetical protein
VIVEKDNNSNYNSYNNKNFNNKNGNNYNHNINNNNDKNKCKSKRRENECLLFFCENCFNLYSNLDINKKKYTKRKFFKSKKNFR